jgi:phospholipase/lecithinase/hemolysin
LEPAALITSSGVNQLIAGGASTLLWATVPDIGLTPSMAILDAQLQVFGCLASITLSGLATIMMAG